MDNENQSFVLTSAVQDVHGGSDGNANGAHVHRLLGHLATVKAAAMARAAADNGIVLIAAVTTAAVSGTMLSLTLMTQHRRLVVPLCASQKQ